MKKQGYKAKNILKINILEQEPASLTDRVAEDKGCDGHQLDEDVDRWAAGDLAAIAVRVTELEEELAVLDVPDRHEAAIVGGNYALKLSMLFRAKVTGYSWLVLISSCV